MSGCNHPIAYQNGVRIAVDPLQYRSVIGAEKARCLVDATLNLNPGDCVTLVEVTPDSRIPTGRTITRYVQYVEQRVPLMLDDDYLAVHLVPIRSMVESLQKS